MKQQTVCVVGEGAWGTAFATLLAHNGYTVNVWCHDPARAAQIKQEHKNTTYLPGITLDDRIRPMTDFKQALHGVRFVFEAIPLPFLRETLEIARPYNNTGQVWVVLSKGLEEGTLFLPSQLIMDVFGAEVTTAVVSGPNFAQELAQHNVTAATIGVGDCALGLELQKMLGADYFRPYISLDPIGVQVGGALKNIIALGIGILDGAGYGDNAKSFFLTRGLHELVVVARALGGKQETMYGLSGVGDLVLTAMGKASRNRDAGYRLGKGEQLAAITQTAEGIHSVKALKQLIALHNLDLPLSSGLYRVVFEHMPVADWIAHIMSRPLEHEHDCIV